MSQNANRVRRSLNGKKGFTHRELPRFGYDIVHRGYRTARVESSLPRGAEESAARVDSEVLFFVLQRK